MREEERVDCARRRRLFHFELDAFQRERRLETARDGALMGLFADRKASPVSSDGTVSGPARVPAGQ